MPADTTPVVRSARWNGDSFQVDQLGLPEVADGDVMVRVTACGVCLTEVHFVDGYYDEIGIPSRLGHEYAGVVEAVGSAVTDIEVGMHVGAFGAMGGFSEVTVGPADEFRVVSPTVPLQLASFLEPVSCCVYAVRRGRIPPAGTVMIFGAGSNGLIMLQLVRGYGAARTIVSEPDPGRRALALQLGADVVIDPSCESLSGRLDGEVVDVAFDTTGRPEVLGDALDVIGPDGVVVMFGVSRDATRFELPLLTFHRRGAALIPSYGADPAAGSTAAGLLRSLELGPLISHRFRLDELPAAFDIARRGAGLKVLVVHDAGSPSAQP
jgi:threonine dehydrogenase-like Zn-dependent dehydrogenase